MNYKVVAGVVLLMLVFLLAVFVMKSGNLLIAVKNELLTQLEEKYQIQLAVDKANFWPLDQLELNEVKINTIDKNIYLSAPVVKVYYNFVDLVLKRKDPLSCVTHIQIEKPFLSADTLDLKEATGRDFQTKLSSLGIEVIDGNFILLEQGRQVRLQNTSLQLQFLDNQQLKLSLQGGIELKELNLNQFKIKDFKIDQFKLALDYTNEQWEGSLQTDFFTLDSLLDQLNNPELINQAGLQVNKLKAEGKVNLNLTGEGLKIASYQGDLLLQNGEGDLEADYLQSGKVSQLAGELIFSSLQEKIVIKDLNFNLAENSYQFNGSVNWENNLKPEVFGHLISPELNLAKTGFKIPGPELAGQVSLNLAINGLISNPDLKLDLFMASGEIDQQKLNDLKANLRYQNGFIYLDSLDCKLNYDNMLSAQGFINSKSKEYSLTVSGSELQLSLLKKYTDQRLLSELTGSFNTNLLVSGQGYDLNNLNLSGEIELPELTFSGNRLTGIESDLWVSNSKLLLKGNGGLPGDGEFIFTGDIDLAYQNINMSVTGKGIDLAQLTVFPKNSELTNISGIAEIKGKISGNLAQPLATVNLKLEEGSYQDYHFKDLGSRLRYVDQNIEIEKLTAKIGDADLKASGMIELTDVYPYLDLNINIKNFQFDSLAAQLGQHLPLQGTGNANFKLTGEASTPEIQGEISTKDTILTIADQQYVIDQLTTKFNWQQKQGVFINDLQGVMGKADLHAQGSFKEEKFDLTYAIDNITVDQLNLKQDLKLAGNIDLTGQLNGSLTEPVLTGEITAENLKCQENDLNKLAGRYQYQKNKLLVSNFNWQIDDHQYLINGEITDFMTQIAYNLSLTTKQGSITDFPLPAKGNLPLPEDYNFNGELKLTGEGNKPHLLVDLTFYDTVRENNGSTLAENSFYLKGELGEQFDLELKGNKVAVNKLPSVKKLDFAVNGKLDFQGWLTGPLDAYNLNLTTELTEASINNDEINQITGQIMIKAANLVNLRQKMILADNSNLNLIGEFPIKNGVNNLDLTMNVNHLPLSLISSTFKQLPTMYGSLDGDIVIKGSPDDPYLDGQLVLSNGELDINLPDHLYDLNGSFKLAGQTVDINNLWGKYGEGNLSVKGKLNPFNQDNLWQLTLEGKDLPFLYGSLDGQINPQITMSGPFMEPVITGNILTHDLIVGIPFSWPVSNETNQNESQFKPTLDFTFIPEERVYVRNNNIDVVIQEGTLRLSYKDNDLTMKGKLTSRQGSFSYYNNKFMIQEAAATFNQFLGVVPELNIKAWTTVSGTRIMALLQGPAKNMIVTFSSQPPLSEDEILSLLTSRGGLGVIGTENWTGIIRRELMRIFSDELQLNVVNKIEKTALKLLSLDRVDINTYNLGWDEEITLYLGKYLNDRTYLQYSRNLSSNKEGDFDLGLSYYLNDNLRFEGSWQGDDDYSLSIETNIEF